MRTTLKIGEVTFEDSFALLAIHSSMEPYKLAFELNRILKTRFKRAGTDLAVAGSLNFPVYEWDDELNDRMWTLFINQCQTNSEEPMGHLFSNEQSFGVNYLIPERREVDYFLKIEQDHEQVGIEVLKQIADLPNIITAYTIQEELIKSKLNLIY